MTGKEEEIARIARRLDKMVTKKSAEGAIDLLRELKAMPVTLHLLQATRVGMSVNALRKQSSDEEVIALAKSLIKSWKKLLGVGRAVRALCLEEGCPGGAGLLLVRHSAAWSWSWTGACLGGAAGGWGPQNLLGRAKLRCPGPGGQEVAQGGGTGTSGLCHWDRKAAMPLGPGRGSLPRLSWALTSVRQPRDLCGQWTHATHMWAVPSAGLPRRGVQEEPALCWRVDPKRPPLDASDARARDRGRGAPLPASSSKAASEATDPSRKRLELPRTPSTPRMTTFPPVPVTCDAVRTKCREMLSAALQTDGDHVAIGVDCERLSAQIEECIFRDVGSTDMKYKNRVRSRISNLKDAKNPDLRRNVLCGAIAPQQIAVMTSEEMASDELKEIRKAMTKEAIREHQMARTGGTPTDLFTCGKCRKKNCTYTQVQTRSSDEPMTTFVVCNECGNRWKFC